ncbi:MAG: twin-arginine translocation signal domain-containing protein [Gammaproteobacteria bacterium]|nr:twin-arginine translocation signal domain-containing protein [Gammaproteobacteria bacterium]
MKQTQKPVDRDRRRFLGGAAAAGVGSAVAAALPATSVLAEGGEAVPDMRKARGYQLTQHVLDYYKSAAS